VGMYNPYRTPEESEEIKEDIFAVLGKVYAAAANAAAESEDELTAGGKQSIDYINGLKDKVAKINEIKSVMEKYNDAAELQELLAMIAEYDDINEVKALAELVSSSEGKPENQELMDIMLSYDDISELQAAIDIIRNYDDISELTELMAVMTKYRTANQTAVANAIASEVAAPLAMKATGKNVDPQMRRLNEKLMDVAEETGAVYVDVYGISPEDDFDPHPNANGHKEIAEILYDTMSEHITERMKVEEKPEAPETTEETLPAEEAAACNFRIVGDVNGDGMINSADAAYILAHSSGLVQLSDDDKKYADIDGNKRVDIIDAILLMSCIDRYNSMYFNRFNGRHYNYFTVYGIRSTPMNHFGRMNGFGVRFR
ncbi:dockerin type I domain-containing protein, partial [Ruminococcus flavefaciens]|uniref:dockerin type I domain-containing protein n=1 Tax=Ruminococcus flavefaciens TaxID=1265 RepID=UPI0003613DDC